MARQNVASTFQHGATIRRGVPKFSRKLADGSYGPLKDLAPASALTYSQETEKATLNSKMRGIGEVIASVQTSLTRSATITVEGLRKSVMADYLAAALGVVTQSASPVSNERTAYVGANDSIQLGNAGGVFNVTSVTIASYEGTNAAARVNSANVVAGDIYVPASGNLHWYMVTVAGALAGSPPTFKTDGTTFADGTATVIDMGLIAYTAGVDYELDAKTGLVMFPTTGAIAGAVNKMLAVPAVVSARTDANGNIRTFTLNAGYTPGAVSYTRLSVGTAAQQEGKLYFYTENPLGEDEVWYFPNVTIAPSGEVDLLADEFAQVEFGVDILANPAGASVLVNGVPPN